MEHGTRKINCSVGILTFNSENRLPRALDSLRDFTEIIISDGGSSDRTLEIAREYGCKVINQYSKENPGPADFHPVTNFAIERNRLIAAATKDWFFYIDSDEYISGILKSEIASIVTDENPAYFAYEIPIGLQSPDASFTYTQWKQTHQVRFFNHTILNGEFKKAMHERYVFDREKYPVGRLKGKWYVPVSKPDFKTYSKVVGYRISVMLSENPPMSFSDFFIQGIVMPVKRFLGMVYRTAIIRVLYPRSHVLPLSHSKNLCYSYWITFRVVADLYIGHLKRNFKR